MDLTEYKVYFRKQTNDYSLELMYCNGASLAVLNSLTCTVPVSQLTGSPFNLIQGDYVDVKVIAANLYGDSEMSPVGGTAYITFIPDAPTNLMNDAVITDAGVIGLDWEEGVSNGGSIILDYTI
jgi:hypothetical protein